MQSNAIKKHKSQLPIPGVYNTFFRLWRDQATDKNEEGKWLEALGILELMQQLLNARCCTQTIFKQLLIINQQCLIALNQQLSTKQQTEMKPSAIESATKMILLCDQLKPLDSLSASSFEIAAYYYSGVHYFNHELYQQAIGAFEKLFKLADEFKNTFPAEYETDVLPTAQQAIKNYEKACELLNKPLALSFIEKKQKLSTAPAVKKEIPTTEHKTTAMEFKTNLDAQITIKIGDTEQTYSIAEAEQIMKTTLQQGKFQEFYQRFLAIMARESAEPINTVNNLPIEWLYQFVTCERHLLLKNKTPKNKGLDPLITARQAMTLATPQFEKAKLYFTKAMQQSPFTHAFFTDRAWVSLQQNLTAQTVLDDINIAIWSCKKQLLNIQIFFSENPKDHTKLQIIFLESFTALIVNYLFKSLVYLLNNELALYEKTKQLAIDMLEELKKHLWPERLSYLGDYINNFEKICKKETAFKEGIHLLYEILFADELALCKPEDIDRIISATHKLLEKKKLALVQLHMQIASSKSAQPKESKVETDNKSTELVEQKTAAPKAELKKEIVAEPQQPAPKPAPRKFIAPAKYLSKIHVKLPEESKAIAEAIESTGALTFVTGQAVVKAYEKTISEAKDITQDNSFHLITGATIAELIKVLGSRYDLRLASADCYQLYAKGTLVTHVQLNTDLREKAGDPLRQLAFAAGYTVNAIFANAKGELFLPRKETLEDLQYNTLNLVQQRYKDTPHEFYQQNAGHVFALLDEMINKKRVPMPTLLTGAKKAWESKQENKATDINLGFRKILAKGQAADIFAAFYYLGGVRRYFPDLMTDAKAEEFVVNSKHNHCFLMMLNQVIPRSLENFYACFILYQLGEKSLGNSYLEIEKEVTAVIEKNAFYKAQFAYVASYKPIKHVFEPLLKQWAGLQAKTVLPELELQEHWRTDRPVVRRFGRDS